MRKKKTIYLAGPINGCTDDQAVTWREVAKRELGARNCLDPMRRDYRGREDKNVKTIVEGDKTDIANSDIMLANCWQVSWGTAMEIEFAYSLGNIPIYAVVPPGARISPWLKYHATVYDSLDKALTAIKAKM